MIYIYSVYSVKPNGKNINLNEKLNLTIILIKTYSARTSGTKKSPINDKKINYFKKLQFH